MNKEKVLEKVNAIFRSVLDNEELVITDQTTANDVDEWDSLNHIALVVEIEKSFNIEFTAEEILKFKDVGEMCTAISNKIPE